MDRMKNEFPKLLWMFTWSQFTYNLLSITNTNHINFHSFKELGNYSTNSGEGDCKRVQFQFPSICFNTDTLITHTTPRKAIFTLPRFSITALSSHIENRLLLYPLIPRDEKVCSLF